MNPGDRRPEAVARAWLLATLVGILFMAVVAGYLYVQVVEGAYYRQLAENNRLRKLPIRAPRGRILDHRGRPLAANSPSYQLLFNRSLAKDPQGSLAFASEVLNQPVVALGSLLEKFGEVPDVVPVLIAKDLALSQVARFQVATLEHPEFEIEVLHRRLYRHGSQTAHVLGYLGEVSKDELTQEGNVLEAGDEVGKEGIEAAYDSILRGQDGERVVVVDSRGKLIDEYHREASQPGRNLALTLDLELQQEAELGLRDQVGAVVALDPRNGEIRALVSMPSYDPNLFARRLAVQEWREILSSPHHPLQNRGIQNEYSPGSVFKPVLAMAGLTEGVITTDTAVRCRGSTRIYNHRFRCWRSQGHGRVNLHQALKFSCDVYFYHLGKELGIERIVRYARLFGFGKVTGIDIAGEKTGLLPDSEWLRNRQTPWYPGETISVAIGQGPLLVTPLQIATLMAALANGGRLVTPHLIQGAPLPEPVSLHLDPEALEVVRRGLWAVVNERGTGAGVRVRGLEAAGKSGTAQVIKQETWTDSDTLPYEHRDHAWFASFAPFDDPQLVVVVFVEHGGMGSRAAGPLVKALYERYFPTS